MRAAILSVVFTWLMSPLLLRATDAQASVDKPIRVLLTTGGHGFETKD